MSLLLTAGGGLFRKLLHTPIDIIAPPPDTGDPFAALWNRRRGFAETFPNFTQWTVYTVDTTADNATPSNPEGTRGSLRAGLTLDAPRIIVFDGSKLGLRPNFKFNSTVYIRPNKVVFGAGSDGCRPSIGGSGCRRVMYWGSYFGETANLWLHNLTLAGFPAATDQNADCFSAYEGFDQIVYTNCTFEDAYDECLSHTQGGTKRRCYNSTVSGTTMQVVPFDSAVDGVAPPNIPTWWTNGRRVKVASVSRARHTSAGTLPSGLSLAGPTGGDGYYYLEVVDRGAGTIALHATQAQALAANAATRINLGSPGVDPSTNTVGSSYFAVGVPVRCRVTVDTCRIGNTPGPVQVTVDKTFGTDNIYDKASFTARALAGLQGNDSWGLPTNTPSSWQGNNANWQMPNDMETALGGFGKMIDITFVDCLFWGANARLPKMAGGRFDLVNCVWRWWGFPDQGNATGAGVEIEGAAEALIRGAVVRPYKANEVHHYTNYQPVGTTCLASAPNTIWLRKVGDTVAEQDKVWLRFGQVKSADGTSFIVQTKGATKTLETVTLTSGGVDTAPLVFADSGNLPPYAAAIPEADLSTSQKVQAHYQRITTIAGATL